MNTTPRPAAAFTVAMEAHASPVIRVPRVSVLHYSLDLNANIPLTVPVIRTPVTTAARVNTPQRSRTTTVNAQLTSTASAATSWITASREGLATTSRHPQWTSPAGSRSVKSASTTSTAMCPVTTMSAAGTTATARSISTIRGRTARPLCSAGDTSMMGSVTHSVTMLDVCMMGLTARTWKDSASKCI